ncbi:MAG: ferrochelatase [Proteobacteria bacterium]|nr:ferrochelatase [Pseudomonadota bacterium]
MDRQGTNRRLAVVLFNLGGPDSLKAVRPFLFNLFGDPAIIRVPQPLRWIIAKLISRKRMPEAVKIYQALGGYSPLLQETRKQADALENLLALECEARVFIAMRYWFPLAQETAREVAAFDPDQIVLLPLYPQYSTTTSGSSFKDWERASRAAEITNPTHAVCCYPTAPGLVEAHLRRILEKIENREHKKLPRLLFSAHGLPENIIRAGDPYAWQVEATVAATVRALKDHLKIARLDHTICYQSRVGPMEWLKPSIEQEISRAGDQGRTLLVVPISFVSEHSETLYELDIKYAKLAAEKGVPFYDRVEALRCDEGFIETLAGLVRAAVSGPALACDQGDRCCPAGYKGCPTAAEKTQ